jgi:NADH dehydrogenase
LGGDDVVDSVEGQETEKQYHNKENADARGRGRKQRVCVIGGGFGGLYTALKIDALSRCSSTDSTFKSLPSLSPFQGSEQISSNAHTPSSPRQEVEVTLVDPKDRFVFLPLLYELAVGAATVSEVAPLYRDLLKKTNIKHKQASIKRIDAKLGIVYFEEGAASGGGGGGGGGHDGNGDAAATQGEKGKQNEFENENDNEKGGENAEVFDQIVVAVGMQPRMDVVPGAKEHAIPFHRVEDAFRLKNTLRALMTGEKTIIRIAVIGGGYSGVEVATNAAEFVGKERAVVSIIDRNDIIMHTSPSHNREAAERALLANGVSIICGTSVEKITDSGVHLRRRIVGTSTSDDEQTGVPSYEEYELQADLVISTLGVQVSKFVQGITDLPKDASGRLITSRSLLCKDSNKVFALGDCSSIDGDLVPSTAQVAIQQADVVAHNVIKLAQFLHQSQQQLSTTSTITSDDDEVNASVKPSLSNFRFLDLGQMLTLGSKDASLYSLGGLVELEGPIAAAARRVVYAARMPTNEQKVKAIFSAGASTAINVLSSIIKKL